MSMFRIEIDWDGDPIKLVSIRSNMNAARIFVASELLRRASQEQDHIAFEWLTAALAILNDHRTYGVAPVAISVFNNYFHIKEYKHADS